MNKMIRLFLMATLVPIVVGIWLFLHDPELLAKIFVAMTIPLTAAFLLGKFL